MSFAWYFLFASVPMDYDTAYAKAIADGKPLIVFVGVAKPIEVDGVLVVRVEKLEGYSSGVAVVSAPDNGKLLWQATVEPTEAAIRQALPVSNDALDEVNAVRAASGLAPFTRDSGLTMAATGAAEFRAANLIAGHTANDFAYLPSGSSATAAGCAAWDGNDWGSCCTYDNYTYAGAAWKRGSDGRRYMHLFVR
jgi:hypothetical protein